jgi:hypothetical protein
LELVSFTRKKYGYKNHANLIWFNSKKHWPPWICRLPNRASLTKQMSPKQALN